MTAPDLVAGICAADARHALFAAGDTVVVAVSGGPDSVALLHALRTYALDRELALHVAHLDHRLRPESAADADHVAHLAAAWDLPASLAAREVQTLAAAEGRSLEEAARVARYAFLARVAAEVGAGVVAVAHTADDQVETVLMNFVRGTGLTGLRGMTPAAAWPLTAAEVEALEDLSGEAGGLPRLVRPLLACSRSDVLTYIHAHGLQARDDASNWDPRFLRNRVRHEIRPLLETINPRLAAALLRLAAGVADDADYLESAVDDLWPGVVAEDGNHLVVTLAAWRPLAPALQRRLLRRVASRLGVAGRVFGWQAVEAVREQVATGRPGATWSLPGPLRLTRGETTFTVGLDRPVPPPRQLGDVPLPLAVPGTTPLPGGWSITTAVRDRRADDVPPPDVWSCLLDADAALPGLAVRARRPGDRLRPLGLGGRQKRLQDLLVDERVPRAERDTWPIVVAGEAILWVVALRVAEVACLRPLTRRVLLLTATPPPGVAAPVRRPPHPATGG